MVALGYIGALCMKDVIIGNSYYFGAEDTDADTSDMVWGAVVAIVDKP